VEYERESRLLSFSVRFGINAAALWLAAEWVRGFEIDGWQSLVAAAAIFAVVNAIVKPVVDLLGLPVTCLTLGLFHLVINAAMLAFTVWIASQFDFDVDLDGFVAAFLAALLISVVSTLLSAFIGRPVRWALR
jgi:putative membrane protein